MTMGTKKHDCKRCEDLSELFQYFFDEGELFIVGERPEESNYIDERRIVSKAERILSKIEGRTDMEFYTSKKGTPCLRSPNRNISVCYLGSTKVVRVFIRGTKERDFKEWPEVAIWYEENPIALAYRDLSPSKPVLI